MELINFLNGRVRAKERELISASTWQQLREAPDRQAFMQLVQNTVYVASASASSIDSFEAALYTHVAAVKQDLFSVASVECVRLLFLKYDFHNMKLLFKEQQTGLAARAYLVPCGITSVEQLRDTYAALWQQAHMSYATQKSFKDSDHVFDQEYQRLMQQALQGVPAEVAHYVTVQLQTIARRTSLVALDPAAWERDQDNAQSAVVYTARYANLSVVPLFVYFRAKEIEIKNLKILYVLHDTHTRELTTQLREAYV